MDVDIFIEKTSPVAVSLVGGLPRWFLECLHCTGKCEERGEAEPTSNLPCHRVDGLGQEGSEHRGDATTL